MKKYSKVVRRRLFENVGNPDTIEQVLTRYKNTYHNRRSDLPAEADRIEYINKMRKAYPFHPELIDMFRLKWGNDPHFSTHTRRITFVSLHCQGFMESPRFFKRVTSSDTHFRCQPCQFTNFNRNYHQPNRQPMGNGDACRYYRHLKQCL